MALKKRFQILPGLTPGYVHPNITFCFTVNTCAIDGRNSSHLEFCSQLLSIKIPILSIFICNWRLQYAEHFNELNNNKSYFVFNLLI